MSVTEGEIEAWLEWAGIRLIAMPGPRAGPSEFRGFWPDYSQERFEIISFRARIALRVAAPGPSEIPLMEQILLLPNLLQPSESERIQMMRKAIRKRTLLHPITERHLFSWARLAKDLETSRFIAQGLYEDGIIRLTKLIDSAHARFIRQRLSSGMPLRRESA